MRPVRAVGAKTAGRREDVRLDVVNLPRWDDVSFAPSWVGCLVRWSPAAEEGLPLVGLRVLDDHRLAAPEVQAGYWALEHHAQAEAEGVDDRVLLGGVPPHAPAAWAAPLHNPTAETVASRPQSLF